MKKYILLSIISMSFTQIAYPQTNQTINNLVAFSKAYGYVKYFHPSDEAFYNDWNKFSAYGAQRVEKCKDNKELVETLNEIFSPIAPSAKFILSEGKSDYNINSLIPSDTTKYKKIYWQHRGVSYNMVYGETQGSTYKSARVNKISKIDISSSFGNILTSINPKDIIGKEIKYEGWAKLDINSSGQGQFWIRVDKSDKTTGFFNNSRDNPVKTDKWNKYEIIGTIDSSASNLVFGCFLVGKGFLYIDNIRLSYKEGDEWIDIPIKNSFFETEDIFTSRDYNKWTGTGEGYKSYVQEKDVFEGKKSAKIEFVGVTEIEKGEKLFNCAPTFGELIEKEIVKGIYCQIPLVLYGNEISTFPKANQLELNKLNTELNKTVENPSDLYMRLGNIVNTYVT